MKLYHFNPHNYGGEWFVMSESQECAISCLNKLLHEQYEKALAEAKERFDRCESDPNLDYLDEDNWLVDVDLQQWGDRSFQGYTIDVHDANDIIESEIA